MNAIVIIVSGALIGLGGLWLLWGLLRIGPARTRFYSELVSDSETIQDNNAGLGVGEDVLPPSTKKVSIRRPVMLRLLASCAIGVSVWALTSWPVLGVGVGVLTWFAPRLLGSEKVHKAQLEKMEAVACWVESLRDSMAAAAGLEQAIVASATYCPPAIHDEVQALAADIAQRRPLPESLTAFAYRLDDDMADLVILALLEAPGQAGRISEVLTELADVSRQEAIMRMRIFSTRARGRSAARMIAIMTIVMIGILLVISGDYLDPYNSIEGQIMLVGVCGIFALAFFWLAKLTQVKPPTSFLRETS